MKKIYYYIISIFILAILGFTGIYYKFNKEEDIAKVKVAEVTHSVFYAPFYVALNNNYFDGLEVTKTLTSGADKVASAVLSGDTDIGLSGLEATIYVYQNNAKDYLKSFSSLTKRDGQFLFGDCKYKDNFNVDILKGKKVLAGRSGGMPSMVFLYALHKNNINIKDVNVDLSVDFANLSGAYIGKQGDFVNLFEPNALALEKEGYGCVLSSIGLMSGELPYTVFHAKKSYIENNKDTIKKFTKGIQKGLEFVKNNDATKIAEVIKSEFTSTSFEDLVSVVERYKNADSWWESTVITERAFNNLLDLMEYNGVLKRTVNYNDLVYNEWNTKN